MTDEHRTALQLSQTFAAKLESFPNSVVVSVNGSFGYREASRAGGSATPVVLLHGIGSGSASWVHQLDGLSGERKVLAWDTPGYGRSSSVRPQFPVATDYAAALSATLAALGIERCVLVGHSLGAIIATAFAAEQPSKVAGLLLISPANGYAAAAPELRADKRDARLAMLDQFGPSGLAQQRSANMLSPAASEEAKAWVRWNMERIVPSGYRQATHLLANSNLVSDLQRFDGRVQVAVGYDDSITPPSACERIAQTAHTCLRIIPQAGHAGYVEQPETYTAVIEQFCHRCEGSKEI